MPAQVFSLVLPGRFECGILEEPTPGYQGGVIV